MGKALRHQNSPPAKSPLRADGGKLLQLRRYMRRNGQYYILLILPILYFIIFRYGIITGNVLAFRQYAPGQGRFGTAWVGLKYFTMLFQDPSFWKALKNTLILSGLNIVIGFVAPVAFALLINELSHLALKNTIQTVSYFPHFVSTVVVVGMMQELLSPVTGSLNNLMYGAGMERVFFMNEPEYFRPLYILSELWQHLGWNTIIYAAALAGIDPQLYEAAEIDGAGRLRQTFSITLPQMFPTMSVVFIISVGSVMQLGFEKVLLMYTPSNAATSDILDALVYRIGLQNSNYSYATALGLFGGVISLILVSLSNRLSGRLTGSQLY